MAATYIGVGENGEHVYEREDGSQFSVPAAIFGPEVSAMAQDAFFSEPAPPPGDPTDPAYGIGNPLEGSPFAPAPGIPEVETGMGAQMQQRPPAPTDAEMGYRMMDAAPKNAPPPRNAPVAQPRRNTPRLEQPNPGFIDGYADSLDENTRAEEAAIGDIAAARAAAQQERAAGMRQVSADKAAFAREQAERDQAEFDSRAKAERETQGAIEALMKEKIDPFRFSKSLGTGGQLGMIVAIGLGGFLAPLNGGRNTALELYERAVERDIAAQESDIANRRGALGMQMSLLDQMRNRFKDERAAREATRAVYWDSLAGEFEANAMAYGSDEIRANGAMHAAQARQKRDELMMKAYQWETETRQRQYEFQEGMRYNYAALASQERIAGMRSGGGGSEAPDWTTVAFDENGKPIGQHMDKERVKTWNNELVSRKIIEDGYAELERLYRDAGYGLVDHARLHAQASTILGRIKEAEKLGAFDAGVERLGKTLGLGKPGWVYRADDVAKIQQARKGNRSIIVARGRSIGIGDDYFIRSGWMDAPGKKEGDVVRPRGPGKDPSTVMKILGSAAGISKDYVPIYDTVDKDVTWMSPESAAKLRDRPEYQGRFRDATPEEVEEWRAPYIRRGSKAIQDAEYYRKVRPDMTRWSTK